MSAHTPGPWAMDPDDCQYVVPASNPNHVGIAIVQRMDHNGVQYVWGAQSEANARLIAAAPELLKALERIAREHDCGCVPCVGSCRSKEALEITVEEIQEIARAAIAKAQAS